MTTREAFFRSFQFNPQRTGAIGVEREFFLVDSNGDPITCAPAFLERVHDARWTHELSACQVEDRTPPCKNLDGLSLELRKGISIGRATALSLNAKLATLEVAPEDMPRDIYPHEPRYQGIEHKLSPEQLMAALRVTGTHIHIGMGSMAEAIAAANTLLPFLDDLIKIGDGSNGERMRLYRTVVPDPMPPVYRDEEHFYQTAVEQGFAESPRSCWHLVRISVHGTVEIRVFGAAYNLRKRDHDDGLILNWVKILRGILRLI